MNGPEFHIFRKLIEQKLHFHRDTDIPRAPNSTIAAEQEDPYWEC